MRFGRRRFGPRPEVLEYRVYLSAARLLGAADSGSSRDSDLDRSSLDQPEADVADADDSNSTDGQDSTAVDSNVRSGDSHDRNKKTSTAGDSRPESNQRTKDVAETEESVGSGSSSDETSSGDATVRDSANNDAGVMDSSVRDSQQTDDTQPTTTAADKERQESTDQTASDADSDSRSTTTRTTTNTTAIKITQQSPTSDNDTADSDATASVDTNRDRIRDDGFGTSSETTVVSTDRNIERISKSGSLNPSTPVTKISLVTNLIDALVLAEHVSVHRSTTDLEESLPAGPAENTDLHTKVVQRIARTVERRADSVATLDESGSAVLRTAAVQRVAGTTDAAEPVESKIVVNDEVDLTEFNDETSETLELVDGESQLLDGEPLVPAVEVEVEVEVDGEGVDDELFNETEDEIDEAPAPLVYHQSANHQSLEAIRRFYNSDGERQMFDFYSDRQMHHRESSFDIAPPSTSADELFIDGFELPPVRPINALDKWFTDRAELPTLSGDAITLGFMMLMLERGNRASAISGDSGLSASESEFAGTNRTSNAPRFRRRVQQRPLFGRMSGPVWLRQSREANHWQSIEADASLPCLDADSVASTFADHSFLSLLDDDCDDSFDADGDIRSTIAVAGALASFGLAVSGSNSSTSSTVDDAIPLETPRYTGPTVKRQV